MVVRKAKLQGEEVYDKLMNASDLSIKLQRRLGKTGRKLVSAVLQDRQKLVEDSISLVISGGGHIQPETPDHQLDSYPLVTVSARRKRASIRWNCRTTRQEVGRQRGQAIAPMQYRIV